MIRSLAFVLSAVAIGAIVSSESPAQQPDKAKTKAKAKAGPTKPISELPAPKTGDKITLGRNEVKSQKDDDGLIEVVDFVSAKEENLTIPSTEWDIDADGWFDMEGFNLTKAYPRSGLWAMRSVKGNRPPGSGSGLPSSPTASLVPQTPPRLYRAGPGDIITHIDGIAVTSYPRYVYAINSAANKRDIPIVVMNGATGRKHLHYITAYKIPAQ